MAAKKNTSMWLEPSVQRRLKMLATEHNKPVGDIIEGLLNFAEKVRSCKSGTVDSGWIERVFRLEMLSVGEVDIAGKQEHEILMAEAERWVGDPKYNFYSRLAQIAKKEFDHRTQKDEE